MVQKKYFDGVTYRSLGPSTLTEDAEMEHLKPYCDNLRAALADSTVSNIAVFGKFGAGKTTVINSFLHKEKNNPEIRPLSLSLATFTREADERNTEDKDQPREGEWIAIERNLVQQMLYGPSNKDLPHSKFKKIESENKTDHWEIFSLLSGFFLSAFALMDPWHIVSLIPSTNWLITFKLLMTSVFILTAAILLNSLITHYPRWFGSAKLGFGQSELSINDKQSAFNEYLDEIIYFFSQKKYNLVILEDIDRFNNINIFEHLRELNQILNKNEVLRKAYDVQGQQPAIKFLYAVKEDLFDNMKLKTASEGDATKERRATEHEIAEATTKFFDWTMTVLPKVSAGNSADFLMEMFENPTDEFRDYLRTVSIYFSDIRVLENTLNDFKLHSELQEGSNLDGIKMFTVLLFKNGFPRQYQRFVRQEGSLSQLLRTRHFATLAIHQQQNKLEHLKAERHKLVTFTQDQVINKYKAMLMDLDANGETKMVSADGKVEINPIKHMTIEQLAAFYNHVTKQNTKVSVTTPVPGQYYNHTSEFLGNKLVIENRDFSSSKYFLDVNKNDAVVELDQQIDQINNQIKKISALSLTELVSQNLVSLSDSLVDLGDAREFVSYSVVNGYMDENVDDYLSYFSGTRISKHDRQLIRKLRAGESLSFMEQIDNAGDFSGDLVQGDLNKPSVQLGEIITYVIPQLKIVAGNTKLMKAYDAALSGLSTEDSKIFSERLDWLLDKIDPAYYVTLFTELSVKLKNDWSKYKGDKISVFAKLLIEGLRLNLLDDSISTMLSLNNFINENNWQLTSNFVHAHQDRANKIVSNKQTMLNKLDATSQADLSLIEYLIKHQALTCNAETIPVVFEAIESGSAAKYSYQALQNSENDTVLSWVKQWFVQFINAELDLGYIQNETSPSIGSMLTTANISNELVTKVLKQYPKDDLELSDIQLSDTATEHETFVVSHIIDSGHVAITWSNVRWLMQFDSSEWRQKLIQLFIKTSNHLALLADSQDKVDSGALRKLVDSTQIQLNGDNQSVLKLANNYEGFNQPDNVLVFFIEQDLVTLSQKLIERVASQSELLELTKHFIGGAQERWDETRSNLLKKLDSASLLAIANGEVSDETSLIKFAIDSLVKNEIETKTFSDHQRNVLLESILTFSGYPEPEQKQIFVNIIESFLSADYQLQVLNRLIVNERLDVELIKAVLPSVKDSELARISKTSKGLTIHLENTDSRMIFAQLLEQRALIAKVRTLKSNEISIRI
ncbi:hypothetical protein [Lacticaseibacillus porcinae]|uniref:YobI family P-loop NTPase n=1 Tax=Lacticaseibacillus porcinae TaxID=1123687 RepID=UPI0013DDEDC7|nr:hypothetical protein [Lacticaseibacillus porcinae]